MNTPDSARSLDEAELARLDDLLALAHPEQSMMLEEYDGFCAALACSPTPISPDDSLSVVLGAEPGVALAALPEADRGELLSLLGRHRRAVARRLYEGEAWNAVIGTDESGRALGDAWAIGFLRAMELHPDDWGLLDEDEVCEEAFDLILRFASEAGA
ncbi:MAG: YecA family protein, partial [Betaproteobacteria bacterium]|nr:YecA family protein [Betaproteobacteria bacterium]